MEGDDLNRTLVAGCPTAALFSVLFCADGNLYSKNCDRLLRISQAAGRILDAPFAARCATTSSARLLRDSILVLVGVDYLYVAFADVSRLVSTIFLSPSRLCLTPLLVTVILSRPPIFQRVQVDTSISCKDPDICFGIRPFFFYLLHKVDLVRCVSR